MKRTIFTILLLLGTSSAVAISKIDLIACLIGEQSPHVICPDR